MPVILKDIAEKLNVSISTISKAINHHPGIVSYELRTKILQTIEEMGYQSSVRTDHLNINVTTHLDNNKLSIRIHYKGIVFPGGDEILSG